ncbi:MAG: alpha/beta fold hydrolase [bacterium]
MATIKVNNTELEYIEKGKGDPVILAHGTLGDYRSWELQMEKFAESYRVISYSRRYHYPNKCNGDETDYSAHLHADDLAGLIDELGLYSPFVVGNSYGAYTGLFLAAKYPEKLRALVLSEPPILPLLDNNKEGSELRDEFFKKVWNPVGDLMQQGKMKEGLKMFISKIVQEGAFDSFPPEVQQLIIDNACEFKVETSSPEFWTKFSCSEAEQVKTPTLLLRGEKTIKMFRLIIEELESCLPSNRMKIIPESTHETPADNPDAFNRIVMEFLDDYR